MSETNSGTVSKVWSGNYSWCSCCGAKESDWFHDAVDATVAKRGIEVGGSTALLVSVSVTGRTGISVCRDRGQMRSSGFNKSDWTREELVRETVDVIERFLSLEFLEQL